MRKSAGKISSVVKLFLALAVMFFLAPPAGSGSTPAAADKAAENLSRALQFQTISFQDPSEVDAKEFKAFHDFLEKTYPLIHRDLTREVVNGLGLVYTWKGTDPAAKPIILLSHIDVVPIAPGTLPDWTYPPFEGRIADGFIWGRGTMDCKGFLMAIMEATGSTALTSMLFKPCS